MGPSSRILKRIDTDVGKVIQKLRMLQENAFASQKSFALQSQCKKHPETIDSIYIYIIYQTVFAAVGKEHWQPD